VAAKSRQFTADRTGKGQFLRGNPRNLAGEGIVKKSSSPQRVASVSNICNSWRQGTWVMRSVAPVLASESARSFLGNLHDWGSTGSLKIHGRRGSQKDLKYPRKILVGKTLGPKREG